MSCGRSWVTKVINHGLGWHWTGIPVKLWGVISALVLVVAHRDYGILCHPFTVNAPLVNRFLDLIRNDFAFEKTSSCRYTGKTRYIERFNLTLRQRVSRLVYPTLAVSKKSEITLAQFGILFIITRPP